MKHPNLIHIGGVILIAVSAYLAYYPGLSNFWLSDDTPNILDNPAIKITTLDYDALLTAATSNTSGPLKRPISSLSFGLNHYFSGNQLNAIHFKTTNLVIHIFNGILIYLISFYLLKALNFSREKSLPGQAIALAIALTWTLHPIQLTAVLYPVQRMTSIAALFVLIGLLTFIIGRLRLANNKNNATTLMYAGIILGTLGGAYCKENALLLPFFALAIELTLFNKLPTGQKNIQLKTFYLIVAIIPAISATLYLANKPGIFLGGYATREFSLSERLMTESRVLLIYIKQLLYPSLQDFSLYHDNVKISKALTNPWSTLLSIISISTLLATSFLLRQRYPVFSFAVLWFFIGHTMESTIFPLALMFEHRNYVPSFSIIFASIYLLFVLLNHVSVKTSLKSGIPIIIILCITGVTHIRADIWSTQESLSYFNTKNNPTSAKAHASRAIYFLDSGEKQNAYKHLAKAAQLNSTDVSTLLAMSQLNKIFTILISNKHKDDEANNTTPTKFDAPLVMNKDYLDQLHHLVDLEIQYRLNTHKLQAPTISALRGISDCATKAKAPECLLLTNDLKNWLTLALNNNTVTGKHRSAIYASRARIHAYFGDIELAIQDLDQAYKENPREIYMLTEKLTLLITLRDEEGANSIIKQIEEHPALEGHHVLALDMAKAFYEYTFNTKPAPSH